MTKTWKSLLMGAALLGVAAAGSPTQADDRAEIAALLDSYEAALNASDTDAVMTVYAPDGVFMPQHSLPQAGAGAIRSAYDGVFSAIDLDIDFIIDEIVVMSEDWAYARTRSEGTTLIKANGAKVPEGNQEIFLLRRHADGAWKIARYIFSTTNARQ